MNADAIEVTVHSLGHADAPAGFVALEDARGKELARVGLPALAAPRNLQPITSQVCLPLTNPANQKTAQLRVLAEGSAQEIADLNNKLALPTLAKPATAKNSQ